MKHTSRATYLSPTVWRTVWHCCNSTHLLTVTEIPWKHQYDWCLSLLIASLFFFFFLPQTTPVHERNLEMKTQPIETTIWRHESALLQGFSTFGEWLKTTFTQICTQAALTSELWLSLFSFFWLCLRLSLFYQTALWHTEHLALCALHIIFMQKMKVDSMPSSVTPCGNPAESWLNECIVGRLDLTQWYHGTEDSHLWFSACCLAACARSLFFFIIILIERGPTAASNTYPHSNIYPCRIQLPFAFPSRFHSSKTLKQL